MREEKLRKKSTTRSRRIFSRRQFAGLSAVPIMAACRELEESTTPRISRHPALQTKLAQDPHRPRYHLIAPASKMGDPNGPIFWNGTYHMFYIHDPSFGGTQSWGHAVSDDLVHWKHLPTALAPMPRGSDKDGCWSGSTIINNGIPTIFYTGVSPEVQCLATSNDEMIVWKKHPGNPVIGSRPSGLELTGFRDPYVWREGKTWYMLIGSGFEGVGGGRHCSTPLSISSIGNTSTRSWSGKRTRSPRPVPVHSAPRAKPGRFGKCPICFLWPTSTC